MNKNGKKALPTHWKTPTMKRDDWKQTSKALYIAETGFRIRSNRNICNFCLKLVNRQAHSDHIVGMLRFVLKLGYQKFQRKLTKSARLILTYNKQNILYNEFYLYRWAYCLHFNTNGLISEHFKCKV